MEGQKKSIIYFTGTMDSICVDTRRTNSTVSTNYCTEPMTRSVPCNTECELRYKKI